MAGRGARLRTRAPGRVGRAACAAVCALLLFALPSPATEEGPPEQGATLRFRKVLGIQPVPGGRAFFETRRMAREDGLSRILSEEYAVAPEALPGLTQAFRTVNPGVDPEHLKPGQEVRIPFKLEESVSARPGQQSAEPAAYTVRAGDNLWRVLQRRFKVSRADMPRALSAVARANPRLRDLNLLLPGQTVRVPEPFALGSAPVGLALAAEAQGVLTLLRELGCRVAERGRTLLPLERGRAIRLDNQEFPVVVGPSGQSVILDPSSRMSAALIRGVEDSWGYAVLQGREGGAEGLLERILPRMGFHEFSQARRTASLGAGLEVLAQPRWSVVPRAEDLWDGTVHVIFPTGSDLSPAVVPSALGAGFSLHVLGGRSLKAAGRGPEPPPRLAMSDAAAGAGTLLNLLGVPHRVRPEVACDLGDGVQYRLRPELTFRYAGISYAVPPKEPARAAEILERAGYVAVPWTPKTSLLDRIADLLSLVGVAHRRATVEVPKGDAPLKLRIAGLLVEEQRFAKAAYPERGTSTASTMLLMTEGELDAPAAAALRAEGVLPWVVGGP